MIFEEARLKGAYLVRLQPHFDERGFFVRSWCKNEFEQHRLNSNISQCNISFNRLKGTLRGMHYRRAGQGEVKVVRCTKGAIYDVIIDLRPTSPTYCQWAAFELSADNRNMLYIPVGFAHGFQTLVDETEVFYQHSEFYLAEAEAGVRWNDAKFNIVWPEIEHRTLSHKDRNWPDFGED